jgi:hypothetical protein
MVGRFSALVATFMIFAPSFVMTLVATELLGLIRHIGAVRSAGCNDGVCRDPGQHRLESGLAFVDRAVGCCVCRPGADGRALLEARPARFLLFG